MEFMASFFQLLTMISEAYSNTEKLPKALISCGVVQASAALALAIFKAPGGIFLHHGKPPVYLYYGIHIFVAIFGIVEAYAGLWVSSDLISRRAIGKTILWISLLPLIAIAGLGGFVILK